MEWIWDSATFSANHLPTLHVHEVYGFTWLTDGVSFGPVSIPDQKCLKKPVETIQYHVFPMRLRVGFQLKVLKTKSEKQRKAMKNADIS